MSDFNSFSNRFFEKRHAMRPTGRTYAKHIFLLLITFSTCTIAGLIQPFGIFPFLPEFNPQTFAELLLALPNLPRQYLEMVFGVIASLADPAFLFYGLKFSVSILFVLICHELGHYIACRIYKVDATLPYFIPTPPLVGPAGTLGAFIKIVSPMPSRRAIFDIGIAGPIAGFIALLPIALMAIATTVYAPASAALYPEEFQIVFSDPLAYRIFAYFGGIDLTRAALPNPFYFATWLGLLVTALNLIPSGQLDGGHAVYALFGERFHRLTGKIVFVVMLLFSILGMYFYSSPSGFLFVVILAVMLRVRHPEPLDAVTPLDFKRKILALLTLVIFILCFVPFPIRLQ